ncbi:MAG: hypothetical protein ABFR75_05970 [Acidobacteriota bacterium]
MKKIFIAIFLIFLLVAGIQSITVDEIIDNNLKVKGGVEKLSSVISAKGDGKIVRMGMEMKFSMWYKKPSMTRNEVTFSDKKMTFAYDGKTVWQISPFTGIEGPQEVTGDQADDIKESAEMFEDPFINYKQKDNKIEFLGNEELEGTEVLKVKLTRKNGKVTTYFIDAESFIELKTETIKKKDDGKEIKLESFFGDFKEVDGMMVAHSIKTKINGIDMGNVVIESVNFNVEVEDSFFKMPEKKEEKESKEESH